MSADLFISYAWTSDQHRQWVRLLASQLKALGFDVLIDADLDYGDQLTGFMRRVVDSRHVLLIVDDNYVDRADNRPDSGVSQENRSISEVYAERPDTWVAVLFKDNLNFRLPAWLAEDQPKGISFNYDPSSPADFPGSEQVEDLWRWIEGLPANRDSATPVATLRSGPRGSKGRLCGLSRPSGGIRQWKAKCASHSPTRQVTHTDGVSETPSSRSKRPPTDRTRSTCTRTRSKLSGYSEPMASTITNSLDNWYPDAA